jgi:general secretion pathway protein G
LIVTVAIVALSATAAMPVAQLAFKRTREQELTLALRQIRGAIDAYHEAAVAGRVPIQPGATGYPPDLKVLVDGVPDARDPEGKRIYFLRRLPRDPLFPDDSTPAAQTWGLRRSASSAEAPAPGDDVYDIHSLHQGTGPEWCGLRAMVTGVKSSSFLRAGRRHAGRGFTLIELLVVMAIIATLLAIALPRYFLSLERAKEATLRQDLAVMRDAIDRYSGDTGHYPATLPLVEKRYLRALPRIPSPSRSIPGPRRQVATPMLPASRMCIAVRKAMRRTAVPMSSSELRARASSRGFTYLGLLFALALLGLALRGRRNGVVGSASAGPRTAIAVDGRRNTEGRGAHLYQGGPGGLRAYPRTLQDLTEAAVGPSWFAICGASTPTR